MSIIADLLRRLRRLRDPVALCRQLEPEGWENLHRADAAGRGILLAAAGDPDLLRRIASFWLDVAVEASIDHEPALAALGAGRRVLVAMPVPAEAAAIAARIIVASGCAVVPIALTSGARLSLQIGLPIELDGNADEAEIGSRVETATRALRRGSVPS